MLVFLSNNWSSYLMISDAKPKQSVVQPFWVQGTLKEYKNIGGTLFCLKMSIRSIPLPQPIQKTINSIFCGTAALLPFLKGILVYRGTLKWLRILALTYNWTEQKTEKKLYLCQIQLFMCLEHLYKRKRFAILHLVWCTHFQLRIGNFLFKTHSGALGLWKHDLGNSNV